MLDNINLQLFAEGGAEGGSQGEGKAGGAGFDVDAELAKYGIKPRGKVAAAPEKAEEQEAEEAAGEAENETTGNDNGAGEPVAEAENERDPDDEFEELIKGKFKDSFNKRTQGIINERFKKSKSTQQELDALYDAIDPYLQKLGIKRGDVKALREAAEKDRTNFTEAAFRNGSTAEEEMNKYSSRRAEQAAKTQTEQRQQQIRQAVEEQRSKELYDKWMKDEKELQKTYPDFNLRKELADNPDFLTALKAGLPMKFAYEGSHFEEKMAAVAGSVAQNAAINTARSIAANRQRPSETGLNGSTAVAGKKDYAKMTNKEMLALLKKY